MTEKQKKFADEYLIDLNGTRAYMAVYKNANKKTAGNNASRLLKKSEIRNYIDNELEKIHSEKIADIKEIMEYLTAVMRGENKEETLKWNGEGTQTIAEIDVSAKDRLKAAELLGKRYGMFTDKVEVNGVARVIFEEDLNE